MLFGVIACVGCVLTACRLRNIDVVLCVIYMYISPFSFLLIPNDFIFDTKLGMSSFSHSTSS
jgi:hypothetical protein